MSEAKWICAAGGSIEIYAEEQATKKVYRIKLNRYAPVMKLEGYPSGGGAQTDWTLYPGTSKDLSPDYDRIVLTNTGVLNADLQQVGIEASGSYERID